METTIVCWVNIGMMENQMENEKWKMKRKLGLIWVVFTPHSRLLQRDFESGAVSVPYLRIGSWSLHI